AVVDPSPSRKNSDAPVTPAAAPATWGQKGEDARTSGATGGEARRFGNRRRPTPPPPTTPQTRRRRRAASRRRRLPEPCRFADCPMTYAQVLFGMLAALAVFLPSACSQASAQATIDTSKKYRILSQCSLKVLDAPNYGRLPRAHDPLQQFTSHLGVNQQWEF